ncbi:MAG: hypothetical protein IPL79_06685 [Myxococcales bacterium]|nr:hypothetical protein [Myxococcales bacterium]
MKRIIALSIIAAAMTAACSKKSTTSGPDGSSAGGAPLKPGDAPPVGPVISKNAREDYLKAAEYYAAQEKPVGAIRRVNRLPVNLKTPARNIKTSRQSHFTCKAAAT